MEISNMLLIRPFLLFLFFILPLDGTHAQGKEATLHANWLKLCKGGTELSGANSIGSTILNCPEDDIEANAAKSQIRILANGICADANKHCSADASRIFIGMQCESLLAMQRAAKCGGSAKPFDGKLCGNRIKLAEFSLRSDGELEKMVLHHSDGNETTFGNVTIFEPGEAYAPTREELKAWQRSNSQNRGKRVNDFIRDVMSRYIDDNCEIFLPAKSGQLSYDNARTALAHLIRWAIVSSACPQGDSACIDRALRLRGLIKGKSSGAVGARG